MGKYLATQIAQGFLDYKAVLKLYPQYKKEIDEYLKKYLDVKDIIPLEKE